MKTIREIFQYLSPKFIVFVVWVILVLAFCSQKPNLQTPTPPEITIQNLGLCVNQNNQQISVPKLERFDKHFICASVMSDLNPIRLTLIIQKEDSTSSVEYTDAAEFVNGPIAFQISAELPDGKYTARILYARNTLAALTFEVVNK